MMLGHKEVESQQSLQDQVSQLAVKIKNLKNKMMMLKAQNLEHLLNLKQVKNQHQVKIKLQVVIYQILLVICSKTATFQLNSL